MVEIAHEARVARSAVPPPIVVRRSEHDRLYGFAVDAMLQVPRAAGALLDELHRCSVADDADVADDIAGLYSVVVYRDASDDLYAMRTIRLVPPVEADPLAGQVSVLSALGAALLGLRPGQSILWNDRRGQIIGLKVVDVWKPGEVG